GDDGHRIVVAIWVGVALFFVTAVPAAAGVAGFDVVALIVDVALFLAGISIFFWAFAVAVARNTQGDEIVVSSLFLTQGPVVRPVRFHLFGALAVSVVIAGATGASNAFGVLVPMFPLALIGLWGARHGTFPPRRDRR
ncbi:MAG TPA: hypothetical protein VLV81_13665, partial [Acidimicrobiia bacterium]|nr:hypothetical protein [Acidimicrobiia bacterium]